MLLQRMLLQRMHLAVCMPCCVHAAINRQPPRCFDNAWHLAVRICIGFARTVYIECIYGSGQPCIRMLPGCVHTAINRQPTHKRWHSIWTPADYANSFYTFAIVHWTDSSHKPCNCRFKYPHTLPLPQTFSDRVLTLPLPQTYSDGVHT